MSRSTYLTKTSEEEQTKATIAKLDAQDAKFLKRKKEDLKNQMEDVDDKIKDKLASATPIDESIINVDFFQYCSLEARLKLLTDFEAKYLTEAKEGK